jgi:hypothetical protein
MVIKPLIENIYILFDVVNGVYVESFLYIRDNKPKIVNCHFVEDTSFYYGYVESIQKKSIKGFYFEKIKDKFYLKHYTEELTESELNNSYANNSDYNNININSFNGFIVVYTEHGEVLDILSKTNTLNKQ